MKNTPNLRSGKKSSGNISLMKTLIAAGCMVGAMSFCTEVRADDRIADGVSIGEIGLGGMTREEAIEAGNQYVSRYTDQTIELDVDGNTVSMTAGELGYYWKNTQVIDRAMEFCKTGNVIKRYKETKDLAKTGVRYDFEMDVDDGVMKASIEEKCGKYNVPHVNASLTKTGSGFKISKESSGRMIDMESSVRDLHVFLLGDWKGESTERVLTIKDDEPVATVEDCERVKDLLGSFSTTFSTSSGNYERNKNIENGIRLLNGITVCQGETMSVNSFLEPWTVDNGWHPGGTYVNGKVENSLGGGICQVSSTLYNAALVAEVEVAARFNHSMSVGYVPLSMDAALAGTWKDLKLRNQSDTPIYIEGIYTPGKITFNIYGQETRPENRKVEYVSETLSTISPQEVITEDPSQPEGYRAVTEKGHTGYKARLWKKVYINGKLESEEVINTSSYSSSPTYITVGKGNGQPQEPESTTPSDSSGETKAQTEPATGNQEPQTTKAVETEPPKEDETEETKPKEDPQEETEPAGDEDQGQEE